MAGKEKLYPAPDMGKKKSPIWQHFGFKLVDYTKPPNRENIDSATVYCNYCAKGYKHHRKLLNYRQMNSLEEIRNTFMLLK